jgi:WD40 repeat protein
LARDPWRPANLAEEGIVPVRRHPPEESMPPLDESVDALRTEVARLRQQARSRDLARVAVSQLNVDPERALLLALEANAAAVTFESRDALQQAVETSHLRWLFGQPGEAGFLHAYFAKDNRHIVTTGRNGVLRWWSLEAREETAALPCCEGIIEGFQPSPLRDRALVTARNGRSGRYHRMIVDLSERKVVASVEEETWAEVDATTLTAFFSQDGHRLAMNRVDGTDFSLWDTTRGVCLYAANDAGRCHGLDQKGLRALLTRPDYSVVVLQLEGDRRTTLLDLSKAKVTVTSLCDLRAGPIPFSADGTNVTAGTSDRVACIWDARDGRLLHILGEACPCHRSTASFSPTGRWIAVQQNDSVATEIWDAQTGKMQCQLPHSSAFYVPLRFLPFRPRPEDAEYAVVGSGASEYSWPLPVNLVSEWDVRTGAVRCQFRLPVKQSFERSFTVDGTACHWPERTEQDDISPDSNWVLRLDDGSVRVYARVETAESPETTSEYGCGYTADRRIGFAVTGQTLVDSRTNRELASLEPHERYWFSSDGRHLVGVSLPGDKPVVHVWDARTGALRFTIDGYTERITTMQFQPGYVLLLIGSVDRTIRLWCLETGAEVARATVDGPDAPSYEAASTPDGRKVAFATSGRLHVWHVERGEIVHAPTTLYVKGLRFSTDGTWLLAGDENVARIWETMTLDRIGEFPWHFASILSGDLSPDKQFAATYGMDGYVRLWEAPGGHEIAHWKIHDTPLRLQTPLRFCEEGSCLDCPDWQRRLVRVERLLALAKMRVFRELDSAERRLYLGKRET